MQTPNSTFIIKTSLRKLISDSNIHSGFRVLIAMALTFVPTLTNNAFPFFTQNELQISLSLCLGVMASGIVETDDNYKARGKFITTIVLCFFIASASVEILMPYPILFTIGLFFSSFAFIMIAVLGPSYTKVGFGSLLIAIYTMIGYQDTVIWYEQPLLLCVGVVWYGLFSLIWNLYDPYSSLREQLAQLYFSLSRYQNQKSALFNEVEGSSDEGISTVRHALAIKNIAIMARFEQSKAIIKSRFQVGNQNKTLTALNGYYFIAEQIHERISASQFLYSQLESNFKKSQILEGYHQLLLQISEDCHQLGTAINDKSKYLHSRRLKWTIKALADQLYLLKQNDQFSQANHSGMLALQAIYDNISGVNDLLTCVDQGQQSEVSPMIDAAPVESPFSFFQKIKIAITTKKPIFKHAVRISTSLSVAYTLQHLSHLHQGFWLLLTVLFVCQPSFSETRKRLVQRSIGTLAGIAIGYPILMAVDSIFIQIILLVFSAFLFFNYMKTNYALAVIFITLFVIFLFNLLTGTGVDILPPRIAETLLGSALSMLAITFIYPDWQFQRFPFLVNQLVDISSQYFKQISEQYHYGRSEHSHYRSVRFDTFKSCAALTSAWQSMLFEPRSKQKLKSEVYQLVNQSNALVAYIAAIASHRHKLDNFDDNEQLQNLISLTSKQIMLAYNPVKIDKHVFETSLEAFKNYEMDLSGEYLLIVEQLRLITFTALDIQQLLHKVNFTNSEITL